MSDGKKLVAALLEAGSVETLRLVTDDLFNDDELTAFRYVREHFRRYGELPSIGTVERETRVRLPRYDENLDYYVRRVYHRKMYTEIREDFGQLRDALTGNDMDAVSQIIAAMSSHVRLGTPDNELLNLQEAGAEVLRAYDEAHMHPGISGIPTGWASLDTQSGGYQPGDLIAWVARMGMGKCMAPHTPVMLSDGSVVRIDSVRPGMQLMGPDSKPRNVLTTTTGREEMFRVTPRHGDAWECNRSHILSLVCANTMDAKHTQGSHHLYSVAEFLALPSRVRANLRLWRAAVDFPARETMVDPYLVGLWLGDGTNGYARFSTADAEIENYLREFAGRNSMRLVQYEKREGFCKQYGLVDAKGRNNYFKEYFTRRCFRAGEKRIPDELLRNTREVRLQVLAGLIDTDGCLEASGHYEIVTRYAGLRDDVLYLARSLGFGASCGVKVLDGTEYWRIRVRPTEKVPVLLPRKQGALIERRSRADLSSFQLESLGEGEYFGVTLDGDSLYLLGDFTVTHNTYILLRQALHAWRLGYSVLVISMEMPVVQIARRVLALDTGINPDHIRKGTLGTHVARRLRREVEALMHVDRMHFYAGGFNKRVGDIETLVRELSPDIVFIDGAYILKSDGNAKAQRLERIAEVFDALKRMTITTNRPIVTTTQFSRQAGKKGKEGSLESISFSDAIAMNASLVYGIKEGVPPFQTTRRVIDTMKGREGESGETQINYRFDPMNFDEVHEDQIAAEAVDLDWMAT